ncbi:MULTISPECIES: penicillin-binding protein activator [Chromohalobacter]|uniref:Penicillin-binding protein activator n=1 Tax=Chromohalobacter beijerinckii TaxID=86179 RepID=A0ABV8XBZ6_9GAMM|nr:MULTISPECIES: penicillin-binding protein activator [Chromohalobacter]MCK0752043.1 penicillin-binding protein activator [Chromohalobacter japonicus]MCK0765107.1 penicillin-binding protein activator [Chromohalobacter beijerinckii]
MPKSLRSLFGLALIALLLAGCASGPGPSDTQPATQGLSASELLDKAQGQSATKAAQSRLQAAHILSRQGDDEQALDIARDLDASQLTREDRIDRALLISDLSLRKEDGRSALAATQILSDIDDIPRDAQQTLRHRRGLALTLVGESRAAAESLIDLQRDDPSFELNDDIWTPLSRLSEAALDRMENQDGSLTQGWVELARLYRQSGGDMSRLTDALDDWRSTYANHPAARRLPSDLSALKDLRGNDVKHIAIFLPESGPLANVAKAIKKGIEARHMDALNQGEQTPQLTYYDSSAGNLEPLYAQATMDGAQVVLGPLDKDLVSQLEQRDDVALPTLALNYGEHDRNQADELFQYGLSAEDEARQAAKRARMDGHREAAALVPDNAWGERVFKAFRTNWEDREGELDAVVHYDPKGSVSEATKRLLNADGKRSGNEDIDMLFLVALPSYARQVPPTLDYYYASDLPVYATSQVYGGQPQPRADHDLNDVMFMDIPWLIPDAAAGGAEALPFYSTYQELDARDDPSLLKLNAMGVDAYELARRLPLMQALHSLEVFGATGTLQARDDGRIQRTLPWAQFQSGVPAPLLTGGSDLDIGDVTLDP